MIILSLICIAIIIKVIIILISGFKSKKNNIDDNDEYSHLENNNTTTTEISEIPKNFDLTVHTENAETPETHQISQTFQVSQPHQIDYKNFYKPKRYLITLNELKFYNILLEIAKELDLILFSQVSLYNILETRNNLDYRTKVKYFNKKETLKKRIVDSIKEHYYSN